MKKQLLRISVLSLFFLAGVNMHAQRITEKKADKEYNIQAYSEAIKSYERLATKGYSNADLLQKLANSYYFNGKLTEANTWYQELFEGEYEDKGKEEIPSEYFYRYAQTLKSVGNYEKSSKMMEAFTRLEATDSRAKLFNLNKNFLAEIEHKEDRYEMKSLVLNSTYSDYGATVFNQQLIFTSARNEQTTKPVHEWTDEHFTSLYAAAIKADGSFSTPKLFAKEINSKVNDATAVFTKDGNTMYFTRNNSNKKGKQKNNTDQSSLLKLYKATKNKDGLWGEVIELPFNSADFNTAHPALTPDDKWLYFSSDRQGTLGQSDIFRVSISSTGEYGAIENLGDKINTAGRESFPFISNDQYLFFASDGHPGLGGLDLFVAKLTDDGQVGPVYNMGTPFNSPLDDFSFYLDPQKNKGFISSNRAGGSGGDDIYSFIEKICQTTLEGIVFDSETKNVLNQAKITIYDNEYQVIATQVSNDKGEYKIADLLCHKKYRIKAEAAQYNTSEEVLVLEAKHQERSKHNIGLVPIQEIKNPTDDLFKSLKLNPIYFDFDQSAIRPDAQIELMKIVEVMKAHPTLKVEVRAHTDSRGKDAYNLSLSNRRAKATVRWIINQGIEAQRITGKGYGETQLLNSCSNGVPCSTKEHQVNRRSEFIILNR